MADADHSTLCHLHLVTINLFLYLVCHSSLASNVHGGGFSVELIRRNSPNSPFYNYNKAPSRSLCRRFRRLMEPSNPNTPQSEVRRDYDGEHLMKLSIGTPPVDIYGVADTGSTLIWTQCEPCLDCYKQKNPKFDPRKSSTYRSLTCDGAATRGVLAKETIIMKSTSGEPVSVKNILIGCGHNNTGETFLENQMGVVGLGTGNMSFISQIGPGLGGKRFSYCLVPPHANPTATSKMSFGNGSEVLGEGVVSTPLISTLDKTAYHVTIAGMSVGDKFVPFNSSETNAVSKGNTILDSGTPNTSYHNSFMIPWLQS
ncbi:aspartic proteinase CDR1-like [Prunus yedoensis var. nudiflora]|uniref:Aspartic proteinase CDR1-like n=1 Tax=Prunus yedoensis var. nudiflora TaxID=2094558 RepID=A0A314YHU2_PRUYE|nr:aspartic proteinase CDR1-like [Prunus yedoensis var. nudiflora]